MTNTIPNVPRELLERAAYTLELAYEVDTPTVRDIRALLSAPSPAGVDGLEVVAWSVSFPSWQGTKVYEQRQEWAYRTYGDIAYTVEDLCRLSDAQAIIDGLRARCFSLVMNCAAELETASYCMTDEEAKRIAQSGADYYRKEARLSAGKEKQDEHS